MESQVAHWSYTFDCDEEDRDLSQCAYNEDQKLYNCESKQYAGVMCSMEIAPPSTTPPTAGES